MKKEKAGEKAERTKGERDVRLVPALWRPLTDPAKDSRTASLSLRVFTTCILRVHKGTRRRATLTPEDDPERTADIQANTGTTTNLIF